MMPPFCLPFTGPYGTIRNPLFSKSVYREVFLWIRLKMPFLSLKRVIAEPKRSLPVSVRPME